MAVRVPAGGDPALHWELQDVAELPRVRAELRRHATAATPDDPSAIDLLDQLILALDEMASNALRHGGGGGAGGRPADRRTRT